MIVIINISAHWRLAENSSLTNQHLIGFTINSELSTSYYAVELSLKAHQ